MNIRDLLDKLDDIEQQKLLDEAEDLLEKVGLRLADYTAAVRGITNADERAAKIGEFARQYGYSGLFDPITGKFVNADGKFAFFGGYEAEVRQLAAKGLIPDAAKTTAVLGLMGQDEKVAKPTSQTAEKLYLQIDKADELIKKAVEAPVSEGLAESLLREFGINTNLLEAITPEEHQLIKKTRTDIEPLLKQGDGDAVEYKGNYENYIRMRNELIAKINALIEAIKKLGAPKPAAAPASQRSGGATTPANESVEYAKRQLLSELSLTPAGQKAKAQIYKPDWKGYLSPEQTAHNISLLKKGYAKLDAGDHVGQNLKDFANMATFGFADKASALASSAFDPNTTYDAELLKHRAATDAYNRNDNAGNLRNAVKAVTGYEMDKDNMFGNMTPGDVAGAIVTGSGLYNLGVKGATKLGGGKVAQTLAGTTTGIVAPVTAALTIGEPTTGPRPGPRPGPGPRPVRPQPNPAVAQMQRELKAAGADLGTYGANKDGVDGILGGPNSKTNQALKKYPEIAKKYGFGTATSSATQPDAVNQPAASNSTDSNPTDSRLAGGTQTAPADAPSTVNQTADQAVVPADAPGQSTAVANADAVNPQQVQSALAQVGVKDNTITPDQLLALADIVIGPDSSAQAPATLAENSEMSRILKLSGMSEAAADSVLRSIFTGAGRSGADDAARAVTGSATRASTGAATRAADELTGSVFRKNGINWRQRVDGFWIGKDKNGKELIRSAEDIGYRSGKAQGQLSPGGVRPGSSTNPAAVASQRAANAVDDMVRGSVKANADDAARAAAGTVDDAARAAAGTVDDAARGAANAADDVAKNWAYKLGHLGGRFARLVKNNKWLALLAALTALGIYMYNKDDKTDPTPGPGPGPNPPRPQPGPTPPGPSEEDKKREEERKRNLDELNNLLKRLVGGWPTDPETAQTIQSAVAVGGKAPEGFKAGSGVSTQPANAASGEYRSLVNANTNAEAQRQADAGGIPQVAVPYQDSKKK